MFVSAVIFHATSRNDQYSDDDASQGKNAEERVNQTGKHIASARQNASEKGSGERECVHAGEKASEREREESQNEQAKRGINGTDDRQHFAVFSWLSFNPQLWIKIFLKS